jgi:hypothetical protein
LLNFKEAMRVEHCEHNEAESEFIPTNCELRTTPRREWELVVERKSLHPREAAGGRRIAGLDELAKLDLAIQARLTEPEIIAVVLYTGPMVRSPRRQI